MASTGYLRDRNGDRFYPAAHAKYTYLDNGSNVEDTLSNLQNDSTSLTKVARYDDTADPEGAWASLTTDTPKDGDMLIIKADSGDIQGYFWSNEDETWYVFSGNVDADHVLIKKDIITAGEYTQIGNVTKSSTTAIGKIPSNGMTLTELFSYIFTKEMEGSMSSPYCSITLPEAGAYEVGTVVTPSFRTYFYPGAYSYAPTSTGVVVDHWAISDSSGNTSSDESGSFESFTVTANTNYKVSATAYYNAATNYMHTNLGTATTKRIEAGSKSATSSSITGYWPGFCGSKTKPIALTSDNIRALKHISSKSFSLEVVDEASQVIIAYPGDVSLTKVWDPVAQQDWHEAFEKSYVDINGVNNYPAIKYSVFVFSPDATLNSNTYTVTLS